MTSVRAFLSAVTPQILRPYWDQLEASPLGCRLAKAAFWSLVGASLSRGLAMLSLIVTARVLGKEGYGRLGIIQSTVGMFGVVAGLGLGLIAAKHVAEFRATDQLKAGRLVAWSRLVALITGGLSSLALMVLASWLATKTLAAPELAGLLRMASPLLPLNALNGVQMGALSGYEAFRTIARINLVSGLLALPISVAGVLLCGIQGAVWALVGVAALGCCLTGQAVRTQTTKAGTQPLLAGRCPGHKGLWCLSLPLLATTAISPVANWLAVSLLARRPHGYSEMGIFAVANHWWVMMTFVPDTLGRAALPVLSERLSRKAQAAAATIFRASVCMNALIVLPLTVICCMLSPHIMRLYGSSYVRGWPTLVIVLATAAVAGVFQTPAWQVMVASGRMWQGALINTFYTFVLIGGALSLTTCGALGLASARLTAHVVQAILLGVLALGVTRSSIISADAKSLDGDPLGANGTVGH